MAVLLDYAQRARDRFVMRKWVRDMTPICWDSTA